MKKKQNYVPWIKVYCIHKKEDIHSAIARCWNKFDTLNYELETPLPEEKIELMKDELSEKIMTEFVALRPRTYSNLTDDNDEKTKKQMAEKSVIKRKL